MAVGIDWQFDKFFYHVFGRIQSANSQPLGNRDAEENRMDKGKGKLGNTEFGQDATICP